LFTARSHVKFRAARHAHVRGRGRFSQPPAGFLPDDTPGYYGPLLGQGAMSSSPLITPTHEEAALMIPRSLALDGGRAPRVQSEQIRVGFRRPTPRTAWGLRYRSSRRRLLRGQFGTGACRTSGMAFTSVEHSLRATFPQTKTPKLQRRRARKSLRMPGKLIHNSWS
jgi:hypothetical protein